MNCTKCHKPNRAEAKFCKWCGTALAAAAPAAPGGGSALDTLIDKDDVKRQLAGVVAKAKSKALFCQRNGIKERMQLSFVITGDAGTGKTTTALALTRALFDAGVVRAPAPETVNPVEYGEWVKAIDKHVERLGNTALIFEEAQKLTGGTGKGQDLAQIDHIVQATRRWREDSQRPVVILTGNAQLAAWMRENPQAAAAFNYHLRTGDISRDGLVEITRRLLVEKYHRTPTEEAIDKLRRIYANDKRDPTQALGAAGHNAYARAYQADLAAVELGIATPMIGEDLIQGKEFRPKTLEEVMAEFDRYVGVDEVKQAVRTIANSIAGEVRAGRQPRVMSHFQFLGNPGTGKTTMARLFADALNALGALPVGHLVEVTKADLVSTYVGDTPKQVAAQFDKAEGGVLFIDEAYQLGNDSHGKDAADTIVALADARRGRLVVIIAGYTKEMGEFVQLNSGLASRFDKVINFRDYRPEELAEIFRRMVGSSAEGLQLSPEAEQVVDNYFKKMYLTRTRTFGNAREVRTAFGKAVERMKDRLAANPAATRQLTPADISGEDKDQAKTVDEILASLDDLVGMEGVKEQLAGIAATVQLNQMRMEMGDAEAEIDNVHIAITGNPGTGKTVVAKRLGQIFKAMGVLSKGHVVERERKTLLDSMANSAGANMEKAVDEALGGVLFIDEAYNLIPVNDAGTKDKDGTAAVEALMTRMSNDAGKFVTVIAGYKAEIDEFIANANPGLARRFTHRIHIDDYTAPQLAEIYLRQAEKKRFHLTDDARALLDKKIEEMVTMKDKNFGNAGTVIKLFDATKERQARRLRGKMAAGLTREELFTIEAADIPYEAPKKVDVQECMRELDQLVGLDSVKRAVRDLADAITVEQQRARMEGRKPHIAMDHYLFLGNPGTGKTTVARIMGNIFYSLGLLPSNKLVEVKPADLVASYVGQTAPKTRQAVQRGMGGVFFIDEAYGLNDNGFGAHDCMPELLTQLNDNRGRMVCIAAGYPREMQEWINLNSGLERRFTKKIVFEDYDADALATIFLSIAKKNRMTLDAGADDAMRRYFRTLVYNKGDNFGNAAEAVNYFNRVKVRQGARLRRLMELPGFDKSLYYALCEDDFAED